MEREVIIYNNKVYEGLELSEFDGLVITARIIKTSELQEEECHGVKFIYFNQIKVLDAELVYLTDRGEVYAKSKVDFETIEHFLISNMNNL